MGLLDKLRDRLSGGQGQGQGQSQTPAGQGFGGGAGGRSGTAPDEDPDEAAVERYRYMLRTAPPETIEQAHAEAFAQLTPEQRQRVLADVSATVPPSERATSDDPQALARMSTRAEMRQPGTLERTFGGQQGGPGGPGGMGGGRGMGMGMGGMIAGTLLASVAGAFVGTAIADAFLSEDPAGGGEEMAAEDPGMDPGMDDVGGGFDDF